MTRRTSIAASLVAVTIVVWLVYYDWQNTSPGQLASAHAQDPRLLLPEGCTACHGETMRATTNSCLACHAEIAAQLSSQSGVHGQVPSTIRDQCSTCHSEHHGPDFRLVSDRSFALAGIPGWKRFDHVGLEFRLAGKHLGLACNECHRWADIEVLPKGEKRFLGLSQQCTSCHHDSHDGRYGDDCAACHGQEAPFARVARFTHTAAFPPVGPHSHSVCSKCHPLNTPYSVEALWAATRRAKGTPQPVRTCADCHASPHDRQFLAQVARRLQVTPRHSCERCHQSTHETFLGSDASMNRQLHAGTGFPLDPPHDQASCGQCHKGFGETDSPGRRFDVAYPGRRHDRCEVCHADPHGGQFANGQFGDGGCLTCHDRHTFRPSTFSTGQHESTRFPLTGAHRGVACIDCHRLVQITPPAVAGRGATRIFVGTSDACQACHADVHDGTFDRPGLPQVVDGLEGCARCHTTDRFDRLRGRFDHAGWTGYPVLGAHARVSCGDCHPPSDGDSPYGISFGRTPGTRCDDCHTDPHVGQFREPQGDCSRCHALGESFKEVLFNHQTQSRFPLDADHVRLSCSTCHRTYRLPDGGTIVRYKPLGIVCGDCHVLPGSRRRPERKRP